MLKIFSKPSCSCGGSCELTHDAQTTKHLSASAGTQDGFLKRPEPLPVYDDHHKHNHAHDHSHGHSHEHAQLSPREEAFFLIACAGFFFAILLAEHFFQDFFHPYIIQGLYLIPYTLCGYPILREGIKLIRNRDVFNEFTLMSTASLVAIFLGQTAEAVGVMLFYRIGEHIQERAAGSSRKSIEKLLATKPTQARLVENGEETVVPVEAVKTEQLIRVRAGEKIPLDGIIVNGVSEIDNSPLTGESLPVSVEHDDNVLGGAINLSGALTIAVKSTFADSHMAKILSMVEEAAKRKSQTERFITRFARYYTPAVAGVALLVALAPPLLLPDASFETWVYRALVMLVISCPCALLISVPLGYFGGIGSASGQGILVKGGNVFDDILKINTVVFDKTGTLTEGKFSVAGMMPAQEVTEQELAEASIIAELHASHPIAQAVIQYAAHSEHASFLNAVKNSDTYSQEIAGKGMSVKTGGDHYLAGTENLLKDHAISVQHNPNTGAIIYVAKNGRFLGSVLLQDTIKKDSAKAVADLNARCLTTIMLTGDREEAAAHVAKKIGLTKYRSGLLPDGKIEALQEMADIHSALFVGDGINDAPILSLAKVGVAMGKVGSEVAIEAADVVLLNDTPQLVEKLFTISRKVRTIVWQNIVFALGIKVLVMCFGIAGISGLWEAIFADVGVALLAVLNSTRIIWRR